MKNSFGVFASVEVVTRFEEKLVKVRNFETLSINDVTLRVVVEGEGPLVILVHGFPQCWYLWRHMIDPLINAGYRVAVPDMRGYGESSAPSSVDDYNIRNLAGDVAEIARVLGEKEFVVVGHDWGCVVAWYTALLYPENCKAVMGMSVPFWKVDSSSLNPPGADDAFWYMRYFQEVGIAEKELEADIRKSLLTIYSSLCGPLFLDQFNHPRTSGLLDVLPEATEIPEFLTDKDMDYYVAQYKKSGFHGPLNWYRNIPTLFSSTPELTNKNISQPAAFIAGDLDPVLHFDADWKDNFLPCFDDMQMLEIIKDAGHWVQLEEVKKTNRLVIRFLNSLQ